MCSVKSISFPLFIGSMRVRSPQDDLPAGLFPEGVGNLGFPGTGFGIPDLDREVHAAAQARSLHVAVTRHWDDANCPRLTAIRLGVLATLERMAKVAEGPGVRPHYEPYGFGSATVSDAVGEPHFSIDGEDDGEDHGPGGQLPGSIRDVLAAFTRAARIDVRVVLAPGASSSIGEGRLLRGLTYALCHGAALVRAPYGAGSSENNGVTIQCEPGHGWGLLSDVGDRPSGLEAVWDLASNFMYDTARHGIGTCDVQVRLSVSRHPTLADVATAAGQLYAPR